MLKPRDFREQRFSRNSHDFPQIFQHQLSQCLIRQLHILLITGTPDIAAQQYSVIRAGVQPFGGGPGAGRNIASFLAWNQKSGAVILGNDILLGKGQHYICNGYIIDVLQRRHVNMRTE
ncbi:hypothetical protein D3C75_911500 [compost metagenome]